MRGGRREGSALVAMGALVAMAALVCLAPARSKAQDAVEPLDEDAGLDAPEEPRLEEPGPEDAPLEDAPEPRMRREVPTAADEPVLGASPLRDDPVRGLPDSQPAPTTVLDLPVAIGLFRLPTPPFYETWWFWTAVSAVVVGVTLSVVVALTTEGASATTTDLVLRF